MDFGFSPEWKGEYGFLSQKSNVRSGEESLVLEYQYPQLNLSDK